MPGAAKFPLASNPDLVRDELGVTAVGRALSIAPLKPFPGAGECVITRAASVKSISSDSSAHGLGERQEGQIRALLRHSSSAVPYY